MRHPNIRGANGQAERTWLLDTYWMFADPNGKLVCVNEMSNEAEDILGLDAIAEKVKAEKAIEENRTYKKRRYQKRGERRNCE